VQQARGVHQEGGKSLRDRERERRQWEEEAQCVEKVLSVIPLTSNLAMISTTPLYDQRPKIGTPREVIVVGVDTDEHMTATLAVTVRKYPDRVTNMLRTLSMSHI